MKHTRAKVLFLFLIMVILLSNGNTWCEKAYATGSYSASDVQGKLNTLKSQYPAGATWNRSFAGGTQCYAFAHYIFNTIFNRGTAQVGNGAMSSNPTCYRLNNVASDVKVVGSLGPGYTDAQLEQLLENSAPGDYIQVKRNSTGNPHSMIVTGVDATNNKIGIFDANAVATNTVGQYTQTFAYFKQRNAGVTVYRYKNYSVTTSQNPPKPVNNPIGVSDRIEGRTGCVNVYGWAFDKDDIGKCLEVHVYIGGPAGSGVPCHVITANKSRPDVNKVYGVGNNHGYSDNIITDYTGRQDVYVYAINIGGGENILLGSKQVYITKDTEPPKITRTYLSEITRDSYRVCAEISDNCGIKSVSIATWSQEGQTDIKWRAAKYNGSGTYFIDIKRSEHSQIMNSLYFNHVWAYDYAGNCISAPIDMNYRINSDTGKNIPEGEYRIVSAKNSDFALHAANGATADGTNIQIYKNTGDKSQTFNISYVGDGFYKVIGTKSGLSLDVRGETYQLETNVMLGKYHEGVNQQWMFKKLSDGIYSIVSRSNGLALDIYDEKYVNSTNVQVYEQHGRHNQQWMLKRVLKDSMVSFKITDVYSSNYLQQFDKIKVTVDGRQLKRNVDYKVSCMADDETVSYVVMGIGDYCDKVVKTYKLKKNSEGDTTSIKETTAKPTEKETTAKPTEKETTKYPESHVHSYSSKVTKRATCSNTGVRIYTCTCGESYTATIPKTRHTIVTDQTVAATCTENGKTEGTHCSVCGEIIVEQQTIWATGHKHKYISNKREATCTTEGYTGDTYCSDCGQKVADGNVTSKNGHVWNSGVITKNATVLEDGMITYTCTVCGEKKNETVPRTKVLEKGMVITDWQNGAQYKVTKSGAGGGTVEYKRSLNINVTEVIIPETVTFSGITYKVTAIASNAFSLNDKLKKVAIGNNVTTIGKNAFVNCAKLVSVKMSENLLTIEDKAFYKCKSLTKITIPSKVKKIGYKAFYGCRNLRSIQINTKKLALKNVGKQSFKGISAKAVIKVPDEKFSSYKKILKMAGISFRVRIRK